MLRMRQDSTVRLRYPYHCLSRPQPLDHCPGSLSALWGWVTLTIVWVGHCLWIIARAVCLHCEVEVPLPLFESTTTSGSLPGQFVCTVRLRYPYHCLSQPRPVDHCPGSLSALWGWGTLAIVWVSHDLWIIARAVCLHCEVEVSLPLFESATTCGLLPGQFVCTVRLSYPYHCFESATTCGLLPGQFVCTVKLRYPYHCLSQPRPLDHCPCSLSALWGWGTLTIVWVNHVLWIIAQAVCLHCEVELPLPLFESATSCGSLPRQFVCTVRLRYPYHCLSQPQPVDHCPGSLPALWGWAAFTIESIKACGSLPGQFPCTEVEVPLPSFESITACGLLPGQFVCTVRLRYPYHCLGQPRPFGLLPGQYVCIVRLRYPSYCLSQSQPVDHCPGSLHALWGWGTLPIVWVNHNLWIIARAVCLHCEVEVPFLLFESITTCGSLPGQFTCTVRLRYPYHCLSRSRPVDHCPGQFVCTVRLRYPYHCLSQPRPFGLLPGQFVCTVRLRYPYHCLSQPRPVDNCPGSLSALWGWGTLTIVWVSHGLWIIARAVCLHWGWGNLTIVWASHGLWIIARAVCLHCKIGVPLPLFESITVCGSLPGQFCLYC